MSRCAIAGRVWLPAAAILFAALLPGSAHGAEFTYQGRLVQNGVPVNGSCNFLFTLWDDPTAGDQLGISYESIATVANGVFTVLVNGNNAFGFFTGSDSWLHVQVRCPSGAGSYTPLSPRTQLTGAPYAQSLVAPSISSASLTNGRVLYLQNTSTSTFARALWAETTGTSGEAIRGYAIGTSGEVTGVHGQSNSPSGTGVFGFVPSQTGSTTAVHGEANSPDGIALRGFHDGGGRGLHVYANGSGITRPAAYVENGSGTGIALFAKQNSSDSALVVTNEGSGDLVKAFGAAGGSNLRFRVTQAGNVHADGGYHCGNNVVDDNGSGDLSEAELEPCLIDSSPADFAELMPAAYQPQPGDVLVIGDDGKIVRSSAAYDSRVVGVRSTRPSYLGNAGKAGGEHVPLVIVGVVPVKVSAENGGIRPGDLLVTSATPGHAMRCKAQKRCSGRSIGKALEPLPKGTGVISMLAILQ